MKVKLLYCVIEMIHVLSAVIKSVFLTMLPHWDLVGLKIIQYFSCRSFVEKKPAQRFIMVRKKGFCFQCLLPGANGDQGKHKEGKCQRDFVCPHQSHLRYPKGNMSFYVRLKIKSFWSAIRGNVFQEITTYSHFPETLSFPFTQKQ